MDAYDGEKTTDIQVFEDLIDGYFSSREKARWFKKHLGSLICGGNPEEKAYFWTGYGRNGKGTIEGLLSRLHKSYGSREGQRRSVGSVETSAFA
jgi:hypothetical protein